MTAGLMHVDAGQGCRTLCALLHTNARYLAQLLGKLPFYSQSQCKSCSEQKNNHLCGGVQETSLRCLKL